MVTKTSNLSLLCGHAPLSLLSTFVHCCPLLRNASHYAYNTFWQDYAVAIHRLTQGVLSFDGGLGTYQVL